MVIGFVGLWLLNFVLSIINAVSVGLAWQEANIVGGFRKLANWSAWVMSACGFTWCYLIIAMIIASYYDFLDAKTIGLIGDMGYLLIIFPVIGTGIAITIDSWAYAWKTKSFTGFGVSSYNTVATGFNIFNAIGKVPEAFWNVIGAIVDRDSGDNDNGKGAFALLVVIFVAVAGFLRFLSFYKRKNQRLSSLVSFLSN